MELLDNNNLKLIPLDNTSPITTHINNCKMGLLRPTCRDDYPDPFRFSSQANQLPTLLEDEEDDLLPAPPAPHNDPPAQLRTPSQPAPAPLSPAAFHTPDSSPQTKDRADPKRPLSPSQSSPNLPPSDEPGQSLPRAASTSRLTRATAHPDDVLDYVYDQLPLKRRLAKLFKKKQQPPQK